MTNQKHTLSINNQRDRLSYLWLALGTVLLPFSLPNWTIPLAAWLFPIFLLRFVRTQPLLRGMLLVLLANVLVYALKVFVMFSSVGAISDLIIAFGLGVFITLPYLFDRVLARRLGGLPGTLVFPLAVTAVWYLLALISSEGTMLNPAYSQYGDLPLMQLVSVTGLWGIVFLMSWLAGLFNWAWEQGFAWPKVRPGLLLYSALLALVLVGGGARLAFFAPQGATVRVAGVTALHYHELLPSGNFGNLLDEKTTEAQRQAVRPALAQVDASLLTLSQQEARAGAKMVVWPESGAAVLQEDEAAFLRQAQAVARTSGIYLDMGLAVILPSQQPPFGKDESVLIDPSGQIVWTYQKAHPIPGEETLRLVPGIGGFLSVSYFAVVYLAVRPWFAVHAPQVGEQFLSTNPAMNIVGAYLSWGGLLLLGSATMRARVFSPWASLLLIMAVVVDFFTAPGGLVSSIAQPLSNVVLVLGLGWMGYVLLTTKGEAEPVPQPVPAS